MGKADIQYADDIQRQSSSAATQEQETALIVLPYSLAVLPFAYMSDDPEQEYFSDGLTEDIITDVSLNPGLFVISRSSTFTYK